MTTQPRRSGRNEAIGCLVLSKATVENPFRSEHERQRLARRRVVIDDVESNRSSWPALPKVSAQPRRYCKDLGGLPAMS